MPGQRRRRIVFNPGEEHRSLVSLIGWRELGHHKVSEVGAIDGSKTDEHATELEADKWAYDWILSSWKEYGDDPRIFTKRTMGVIFTLAMTEEFQYLSKKDSFSTHPRAVDRLIRFYNDYEKKIEESKAVGTCFSAISLGLQMVAFNNKVPLPKGPYDGIRGFLESVKARPEAPSVMPDSSGGKPPAELG